MRMRFRAALLSVLAAAAAFTAFGAFRSLRRVNRNPIPEEIYARFEAHADTAQFFLRSSEGYVAVYDGDGYRAPLSVTGIELQCLRGADRAMVEAGIPVTDRRELLLLLEDLGS